MDKKKILLIEPDVEQRDVFANWIKNEGYQIDAVDNPEKAYFVLDNDKIDMVLIDIDSREDTEGLIEMCKALKKNPLKADIPLAVFFYKKNEKSIAMALDSGADSFLLKPCETNTFKERLDSIFKEIELKKKGKKLLDVNYINSFVDLTAELNRNDFFLLAPAVFNKLILEKIDTLLGELIVKIIFNRVREIITKDYPFMGKIAMSGNRMRMDGVVEDSGEVRIEKLVIAFRGYMFTFLQLVKTLTSNILMEDGRMFNNSGQPCQGLEPCQGEKDGNVHRASGNLRYK